MLVVIPSAPYGRAGAVLSALIVVACLIGLTMHKDFYAGVRRRGYYCYYTNLSNLMVLLYFAVGAPVLYSSSALAPLIPHVEFVVMMGIMLTNVIFHFLLLPYVRRIAQGMPHAREFAIMRTDNLIEHYIVPLLTLLYWLLCAPGKAQLRLWDAPLFTLAPLAYLVFIFVRAPLCGPICGEDSPYPYPFLNVKARGRGPVFATIARLYALCILCGGGVILLTQGAFSLFGAGHMLVLI